MKLKFTCPKCGSNALEVIEVNCIIKSDVDYVDTDAKDLDLILHEIADQGDIDHFQCSSCKYILRHKDSTRLVQSTDGLVQWIKDNWDPWVCGLKPNSEYAMVTIKFAIPVDALVDNYTDLEASVFDMLNDTLREKQFEPDTWFHDYSFEGTPKLLTTNDFPEEGQFFK